MKKITNLLLSFVLLSLQSLSSELPKGSNFKIPYAFTENKGQIKDTEGKFHDEIKYTAQLDNTQLYFKPEGISYVFNDAKTKPPLEIGNESVNFYRTDIEFVGCNKNVILKTEGKPNSIQSYYTDGKNKGTNNIGCYNKIIYQNIYNNIDLIYTINENGLKYDFVVRPGGNPKHIQLRYIAADSVNLSNENGLTITNPLGKITDANPLSYVKETKQNIKSNFIKDRNTISFNIESYDTTQTLIIDPFVRMWGTYFNGDGGFSFQDQLNAMDYTPANGAIYITGYTRCPLYIATVGAFATNLIGDQNAFLARFSTNGNIVWATYFGSSDFDVSYCVAATTSEVVIAGSTISHTGMASSNNVQQTTNHGSVNGFIAKFDVNGTRIWSTYFGGSQFDEISQIDVEPTTHKIAICGRPHDNNNLGISFFGAPMSTSGLATNGAFMFNPPATPVSFVAEFLSNGLLGFCTYMPNQFAIRDVKIKSNNSIVMVGDGGFIGVLNPTGSALSSSVSGLGNYGRFDIDAFDNILAAGTLGSNLLISKYNSQCVNIWSNSNTGFENGAAISVISNGDILIGSSTSVTINSQTLLKDAIKSSKSTTSNPFIAKFNSSGVLKHFTYYGTDNSGGQEWIAGLVADNNGYIALAGLTYKPYLAGGFSFATPNSYLPSPHVQTPQQDIYSGFIGYLQDNEINLYYANHSNSPNQVCAGANTITVTFSTLHNFPSMNYFTLELSDAVGSFANPIYLGMAYGSTGTTITGTVPANTPNGNGYKVRVKNSGIIPGVWYSNSSSVNSSSQFAIQQVPAKPTLFNNTPVCSPKPINLSTFNVPGASYAWLGPFLSSALQNPTLTSSSTFISGSVYSMVVTVNGCSSQPGVTTITVNPTPVTRTITPSTTAKLCAGQSVTLSVPYYSGETFLWFKNGSQILPQPNQNIYVANASGNYYVVISIGNCSVASSTITLDFGNCGSRLIAPSLSGNEEQTIETKWKIYPNPTEGLCIITSGNSATNEIADIFVLNNLGQLLFKDILNTNKPYQLNLFGFDAGSYLIKIISGKTTVNKSLIIAR